jgi:hypothetical protein
MGGLLVTHRFDHLDRRPLLFQRLVPSQCRLILALLLVGKNIWTPSVDKFRTASELPPTPHQILGQRSL